MIGYRISRSDIEKLIERKAPGWLKRAQDRTNRFVAKRKFEEKKSIWSEVKPIYMHLQGRSKCAFCERKLKSKHTTSSITLQPATRSTDQGRTTPDLSDWRFRRVP